jgi:hypothetical protein
MDIDEMLESPLRMLEKSSPRKPTAAPPAALEETITLSPRMGSPGETEKRIYPRGNM